MSKEEQLKALLGKTALVEESKQLSNGKYMCLICSRRPILDTLEVLAIHRNGKKHKLEYETWLQKHAEKKRAREEKLKARKRPKTKIDLNSEETKSNDQVDQTTKVHGEQNEQVYDQQQEYYQQWYYYYWQQEYYNQYYQQNAISNEQQDEKLQTSTITEWEPVYTKQDIENAQRRLQEIDSQLQNLGFVKSENRFIKAENVEYDDEELEILEKLNSEIEQLQKITKNR